MAATIRVSIIERPACDRQLCWSTPSSSSILFNFTISLRAAFFWATPSPVQRQCHCPTLINRPKLAFFSGLLLSDCYRQWHAGEAFSPDSSTFHRDSSAGLSKIKRASGPQNVFAIVQVRVQPRSGVHSSAHAAKKWRLRQSSRYCLSGKTPYLHQTTSNASSVT